MTRKVVFYQYKITGNFTGAAWLTLDEITKGFISQFKQENGSIFVLDQSGDPAVSYSWNHEEQAGQLQVGLAYNLESGIMDKIDWDQRIQNVWSDASDAVGMESNLELLTSKSSEDSSTNDINQVEEILQPGIKYRLNFKFSGELCLDEVAAAFEKFNDEIEYLEVKTNIPFFGKCITGWRESISFIVRAKKASNIKGLLNQLDTELDKYVQVVTPQGATKYTVEPSPPGLWDKLKWISIIGIAGLTIWKGIPFLNTLIKERR